MAGNCVIMVVCFMLLVGYINYRVNKANESTNIPKNTIAMADNNVANVIPEENVRIIILDDCQRLIVLPKKEPQ